MRLGKAFSDSIHKGYGSKRLKAVNLSLSEEKTTGSWRLFSLFVLFVLGFVILEARLFHLTIVNGSKNRLISEENRTREKIVEAPRGIIFDRFGVPLVHNVPFYIKTIPLCQSQGGCEQLTLEELQNRQISPLDTSLTMRIGRMYPYKGAFAHILGYVSQASKEELIEFNRHCPEITPFCRVSLGAFIGRGGVEEMYDTHLRGISGRDLTEIDVFGKPIRVLGRIDAKKGDNLTLSVDKSLQELSYQELGSRSGVIVVSNPKTGEILALSSSPSFDPNLFAQGDPRVSDVLKREDQPLFNRGIAGLYPPGSTFKIVTAAAALEEEKITPATEFEDTGILTIGAYKFPNWYFLQYGKTDGMVNIVKAIARSNDIFFYHAGELIGIDTLAKRAKTFGIGEKLGIDLPGEKAGLMPTAIWKQQYMNEQWFLGDTYHVAIGQGNLLVTPLQVNVWTNVIANGGKLCMPMVMKQEAGIRNKECKNIGLKKETIALIKEGMRQACQPGGTGWPLFKFRIKNLELRIDDVNYLKSTQASGSSEPWVEIPVACKTGTAEYGDLKGKTHAWFTSFAPVVDPQISVTVLVEGGGEGSSVAGPIAKKIYEYWFTH